MKHLLVSVGFGLIGAVFIMSHRGNTETAFAAYEAARKDYENQLEYCAHLRAGTAEFDAVCRDLPNQRPMAPQ